MNNKNKLMVVMYHYVRDLSRSRYPEIKGLDISDFKDQIVYLKKNYNPVSVQEIVDYLNAGEVLPENAVLLTFDDAYIDHYTYVFPVLDYHGIQGAFYVPVSAIKDHKVLNVNKIHFILASCQNIDLLVSDIYEQLDLYRSEYALESNDYYYQKLAKPFRLDSKEAIFIKRLLQVELNNELRSRIANNLFVKYVGVSEEVFSQELYMNLEQIKTLARNGMHIGAHCYEHFWLSSLNYEDQEKEINSSFSFLNDIGMNPDCRTMCYPYGDYNDITLEILKKYHCKLAFTSIPEIARLTKENALVIPRIDTVSLPPVTKV